MPGQFVLQTEHFREFPVIGFRPKGVVVGSVDQLNHDVMEVTCNASTRER
jgi:hypothetical protein